MLDGSGRIVVAMRGGSDTLYTIQQKSWNSADIWENMRNETTGVTSRPTATVDASAHAQIFYRGSDGATWRVGQTADYEASRRRCRLAARSLAGRPPSPVRMAA